MTSSIIDFLEARLAEDEAAARAATPGQWEWDGYDREYRTVVSQRVTSGTELGDQLAFVASFMDAVHILRHDPARVLREVRAKRAILERESAVTLPEWKPDCGGDWVLGGDGFFANYWPDNTVSASITDGFDGPTLADSGIVSKDSRAACQAFAESWVREHLPQRSPVLRALAAIYSDHESYRKEWAA